MDQKNTPTTQTSHQNKNADTSHDKKAMGNNHDKHSDKAVPGSKEKSTPMDNH